MSEIVTPKGQPVAPSVTPTPEEIAWAAGFLEGEGSFTWQGKYFKISAVQVDNEPLRRLLRYFGGSIREESGRRAGGDSYQRQPSFRWTLCGNAALEVGSTLRPWLSARRQARIPDLDAIRAGGTFMYVHTPRAARDAAAQVAAAEAA
jgi:hypothetical protein